MCVIVIFCVPACIQPDELASALRELEHSASSDAAVRERIAKLPPEVQDVSLLEKIKGNNLDRYLG